MLVALLTLLAAAEAAVVNTQGCSSRTYATVHSTYQASGACIPLHSSTNTSRLVEELSLVAGTQCNSSTGCTVHRACVVNDEIHLELHSECSCTRIDEGICLRKANVLNKKLQDAIRLHFSASKGSETLRVTGYNLKLSEDCGTATPPTVTTQAPCHVCDKTVTGTHGGFNSSDANPGAICQYRVCASNESRYLLLGFYQAPHVVPASVQEGDCSGNGQPILASCRDDNEPCLTVVQNSCACVRFQTSTCAPMEDLQGKYVAFRHKYLEVVEFVITLPEAIKIAKNPDLWPKLAELFGSPGWEKISQLKRDPDFGPLIKSIPWKYQVLFL